MNQVLTELQSTRPDVVQLLKKRAWHRFGSDHPDRDLLDPLPVPLTILGTKYDQFQDMEPERRKMLCRTLRFVAHTNGASLYVRQWLHSWYTYCNTVSSQQFVSMKSDVLVNRMKQLMNHLAFGAALR